MKKKGIFYFLARVFSNESRDLFFVRLGVSVALSRFGITGNLSTFFSYFLRGVLGVLIEDGIFKIDITMDSIKEARKLKNFDLLALAAYEKTIEKVYDENGKNKIRADYLNIITDFGPVK